MESLESDHVAHLMNVIHRGWYPGTAKYKAKTRTCRFFLTKEQFKTIAARVNLKNSAIDAIAEILLKEPHQAASAIGIAVTWSPSAQRRECA